VFIGQVGGCLKKQYDLKFFLVSLDTSKLRRFIYNTYIDTIIKRIFFLSFTCTVYLGRSVDLISRTCNTCIIFSYYTVTSCIIYAHIVQTDEAYLIRFNIVYFLVCFDKTLKRFHFLSRYKTKMVLQLRHEKLQIILESAATAVFNNLSRAVCL